MDSQEFKAWRTSLGLTQKQVAKIFKITEVAMFKRENGRVAISPETELATRYLTERPEVLAELLARED